MRSTNGVVMAPPGDANVFMVVTCFKCKKSVTTQMDDNHDCNMPQFVDMQCEELGFKRGENTCVWHCPECKNDPEA